ncbi:transmembrane 9 superfamily member [Anaeramoeba flamelloides]|uniref:Transmembrane 9 superfamily member n=1 Tax=Anaeramoeba flamelloides TaxID=1746091 RepID=A0ABQ8XXC5_9EUKA|nr:transmembrane 9 superfamily member [Anaeramoeba flamelloides]
MSLSYQQTLFLFLITICCTTNFVQCDLESHHYEDGEKLHFYQNKIGKLENPQQTYEYSRLPFCQRKHEDFNLPKESLGSSFQGNKLFYSGMKARFKKDTKYSVLCKQTLTQDDVEKFTTAVQENFWFEMYFDSLPIWGMIGKVDKENEQVSLFTHKSFTILFNDDRVIEVNLVNEGLVSIIPNEELVFTYSINWVETDKTFSERFEKYLNNDFFHHKIHWFSLVNSFVMVLIIVVIVFIILSNILKKDYAKFTQDMYDYENIFENGFDTEFIDETGWKQLSGEIHRIPSQLTFLASLFGIGIQNLVIIILFIIINLIGQFYQHRGSSANIIIGVFIVSSPVSGYISSAYYAYNRATEWKKTLAITILFQPVTYFIIIFFLNLVSTFNKTTSMVPFKAMVILVLLWLFLCVPLTVVGNFFGRNWNIFDTSKLRIISKTNPKPIPTKRWYLQSWFLQLCGGFLPFLSILIELYFLMTSFWNFKFHYLFGFIFLVLVILVIVISSVSVVIIYIFLNSGDYKWQWMAFLSSASTSLYVWLYSFFYFFTRTAMSGFFQTSFYFGYMTVFCIFFGLICGSIGLISSRIFIIQIYKNLKID